MKKHTTAPAKQEYTKQVPTHNPKLNYFGAGRLLDYLDA